MTEIQRIETSGALATKTPHPMEIISAAVASGMPPEALGKLVELAERMDANNARKAFSEAMARFGSICPPVQRKTENSQFQITRDGRKVNRMYASLDDIAATVRKPLAECGLSYRWSNAVVDGGKLTITCVVSHEMGHAESSSITLPTESRAGCSEAQKIGSVNTYAQRYSLVNALGLTSCDEDNDGNAEQLPECITEGQAIEIADLLEHSGADRGKFLEWIGAASIAQIPASKCESALDALRRRIRGGKP